MHGGSKPHDNHMVPNVTGGVYSSVLDTNPRGVGGGGGGPGGAGVGWGGRKFSSFLGHF